MVNVADLHIVNYLSVLTLSGSWILLEQET